MNGKISWIVAIVLLGAFVGFIGFRLLVAHPDKPTIATTRTGVLEKQRPEMPITDILAVEIDNNDAAGEHYAAAVKKFEEKQRDFEEIYTNFTESETAPELYDWQIELINQLRELMAPAKKCGKMEYIFVQTPKELRLTAIVDDQEGLTWLAKILNCMTMHYELKKDWKNALAAAEDMLVLGWQMCNDDSRVNIEAEGLELQADATKLMAQYYEKLGNKALAEKCEKYYQQTLTAATRAQQKFSSVWTLRKREGNKQGPYPGDLFNIIENDESRAWKVEAILAMSIAKIQEAKNKGNTQKINELLAKAAKGNDPLMAKAAELTKKASKEDVENALKGD